MDGIIASKDMSLSKRQVMVKDREAWCAAGCEGAELGTAERLNNNLPILQTEKESPEKEEGLPTITTHWWAEGLFSRRGRVKEQTAWALTSGRWKTWRAVGRGGARPHSGAHGSPLAGAEKMH